MALKKLIETPIGPVEYWALGLIQIDNFSKAAYLRMYGFFNENYRHRENAQPATSVELNITPEDFQKYFSEEAMQGRSVYEVAYETFKQMTIVSAIGEEYSFADGEDM